MCNFVNVEGVKGMNEILLINRTNPKDFSNKKNKMCFIIGGMNIPSVENRLIELLNKSGVLGFNDITYKYNGVELNITTQQIPTIIKLLVDKNISIYGIFEVYNPKL